jgi:hypothetical protein
VQRREYERLRVGAALERDPGEATDAAVGAVAASHVADTELLGGPILMAERAGHLPFFRCEPDQLHAPLDGDTTGSQVLIQDRFGLGLRYEQQEWVRGVLEPDVEQPRADQLLAEMHLQVDRVVATRDQRLRHAETPQHLEGARQHHQCARLVHAIELAVDDPDRRTERVELRRERETRGAATDN